MKNVNAVVYNLSAFDPDKHYINTKLEVVEKSVYNNAGIFKKFVYWITGTFSRDKVAKKIDSFLHEHINELKGDDLEALKNKLRPIKAALANTTNTSTQTKVESIMSKLITDITNQASRHGARE